MANAKKLRAEDGTELEVHEGMVLAADGTPLTEDPSAVARQRAAGSVRVYQFNAGWAVATLVVIALPLFFFTGFAALAALLVVSSFFSLLNALFRKAR